MNKVTIYTDGACKGNPGKGGCAAVILYTYHGQEYVKEVSKGYKETTNNRMELMAAIIGLSLLKNSCEIILHSDSKYLVDAFTKGWIDNWLKNDWKTSNQTNVKNKDLWIQLLDLNRIHKITFKWVKGHNNNFYNERCDQLAVRASNQDNLLIDSN